MSTIKESLLKDGIDEKKFDVRMIEKNIFRNVITEKEVKQVVETLPDDSENAAFISLDDIANS